MHEKRIFLGIMLSGLAAAAIIMTLVFSGTLYKAWTGDEPPAPAGHVIEDN